MKYPYLHGRRTRRGPPKVFSERRINDCFRQQISTTDDRVHVRSIRPDGSVTRTFRFSVDDLPILERALTRAGEPRVEPVGSIPLKFGDGALFVAAGNGKVLLHINLNATTFTYRARLFGAELPALRAAVDDLKSRYDAALEKETSHDHS